MNRIGNFDQESNAQEAADDASLLDRCFDLVPNILVHLEDARDLASAAASCRLLLGAVPCMGSLGRRMRLEVDAGRPLPRFLWGERADFTGASASDLHLVIRDTSSSPPPVDGGAAALVLAGSPVIGPSHTAPTSPREAARCSQPCVVGALTIAAHGSRYAGLGALLSRLGGLRALRIVPRDPSQGQLDLRH